MGSKRIPDRWLDYIPFGRPIKGTNIIAFKVPLQNSISAYVDEKDKFTPDDLMKQLPKLGLIIDLTNTHRYYNPEVFQNAGIQHVKILTEGHAVPNRNVCNRFDNAIKDFRRENLSSLIGVHCTHGVNRTGYLICSYLINVLKMEPGQAIKKFNRARGHELERSNYIQHLESLPMIQEKKPIHLRFEDDSKHATEYGSTQDDRYNAKKEPYNYQQNFDNRRSNNPSTTYEQYRRSDKNRTDQGWQQPDRNRSNEKKFEWQQQLPRTNRAWRSDQKTSNNRNFEAPRNFAEPTNNDSSYNKNYNEQSNRRTWHSDRNRSTNRNYDEQSNWRNNQSQRFNGNRSNDVYFNIQKKSRNNHQNWRFDSNNEKYTDEKTSWNNQTLRSGRNTSPDNVESSDNSQSNKRKSRQFSTKQF